VQKYAGLEAGSNLPDVIVSVAGRVQTLIFYDLIGEGVKRENCAIDSILATVRSLTARPGRVRSQGTGGEKKQRIFGLERAASDTNSF